MMTFIRQQTVHLAPGAFVSGQQQEKQVLTVLGSCISLVLWHAPSQFYAMCHYVCISKNQPMGRIQPPDGRYGDQILPHMLRLLEKRRLDPSQVEASLYGGAVSQRAERLVPSFQVGLQNSEFALQFCQQHRIRLQRQMVATEFGLKLKFQTTDGIVTVQQLPRGVAE